MANFLTDEEVMGFCYRLQFFPGLSTGINKEIRLTLPQEEYK